MEHVQSKRPGQDFVSGLAIATLGIAIVILGRSYPKGALNDPGPGLFPFVIGGLLTILGSAIAYRGREASRWNEKVSMPSARPMLAVLAVMLFGLGAETLGFVISAFILIATAVFASARPQYRDILWLSVFLIPSATAIFIMGLDLLIPAWP